MKRRRLTPAERMTVYNKCNGHCAYCGCELEYTAMQVDHVEPFIHGGADELDNMLPACRSCNHYKSSMTLEGFRYNLERMPMVLERDCVTYKIAKRFGIVQEGKKKVKFYFESEENNDDKEICKKTC